MHHSLYRQTSAHFLINWPPALASPHFALPCPFIITVSLTDKKPLAGYSRCYSSQPYTTSSFIAHSRLNCGRNSSNLPAVRNSDLSNRVSMSPNKYSDIIFEVVGQIGIIKFNRPKSLNSFGGKLMVETVAAIRELNEHPDTVFTVLTGEGRFFSAGADVKGRLNWPRLISKAQVLTLYAVPRRAFYWGILQ